MWCFMGCEISLSLIIPRHKAVTTLKAISWLLTQHWEKVYRVEQKKAAKLSEFSLNFPKLADWLCMGWSVCQAAAKAWYSNRGKKIFAQPVGCGAHFGSIITWRCPASSAPWRTEIPVWSWRGRRRRRRERPSQEREINERFNKYGRKIMAGNTFVIQNCI